MANLSSSTGYTPLQTRIPLVNNATTNVQDFALYDAQTLTGLVYIDATTDKRAAVTVTVVRNGAGTYEVGATDIVGDDNGGLPIVSFSMSGSILQATLVSYTGFVSAYIQFHLAAPVFGANYPLTVSTTNIVGRTDGAAQSAGYIGETLQANGGTGGSLTPGGIGAYSNIASITLTPGTWAVNGTMSITAGATTAWTQIYTAISKTSNGQDTNAFGGYYSIYGAQTICPVNTNITVPTGTRIIAVSSSTPVYLNGYLVYTTLGGALYTSNSFIQAVRIA